MYMVKSRADESAMMTNGARVSPLVTLEDEHGGVSHIIMDDRCYVLLNKVDGGDFVMVFHWYREAYEALAAWMQRHDRERGR